MAIIDEYGLWRGKVGDYVYFVLDGKQCRRSAPGPRKGKLSEGLKKSGLFATEFGLASSAAKYLRTSLAQEFQQLGNPSLHHRFTAIVLQIKNLDPAPAGTRTFVGGLGTKAGKAHFSQSGFHQHQNKYPKLLSAVIRGTEIEATTEPYRRQSVTLTVLQINLESGDFQRYEYPLPTQSKGASMMLQKKFRSKKGHMELMFISSATFLQGVVMERFL